MKISKFILQLLMGSILFIPAIGHSVQCTDRLENQLSSLPDWMTEFPAENKDDVSLACINEAMDVFFQWTDRVRVERQEEGQKELGHYAYCEASSSKPRRSHSRPCPTDNYLNVVSNSFNTTLKCLGFKPKDLFAITAVESGFQVNTLSIAGIDIGIGQLTPVAVEDVNPHWNEYVEKVMENSDPGCENIKQAVKNFKPAQKELVCNLISLPENPVKNLIYLSFLHFKNREYMKTLFDSSSILSSVEVLVGRSLETEEADRLREILVTLSYNAGSFGAIEALDSFIGNRKKALAPLAKEFEELSTHAVDLYLVAQQFSALGKEAEASKALDDRQNVLNLRNILASKISEFRVPLNDFAINDSEDSFGTYIVKSDKSHYLKVLKNRIGYIESNIDAVGKCAPENYLESIEK